VDRKYITMLANSNYFVDYVEAVLLDERTCLNNPIIYNFLSMYFPKVTGLNYMFLVSVFQNFQV
jgi:ubiquitin carboxyl-terminal hydrolase 34